MASGEERTYIWYEKDNYIAAYIYRRARTVNGRGAIYASINIYLEIDPAPHSRCIFYNPQYSYNELAYILTLLPILRWTLCYIAKFDRRLVTNLFWAIILKCYTGLYHVRDPHCGASTRLK